MAQERDRDDGFELEQLQLDERLKIQQRQQQEKQERQAADRERQQKLDEERRKEEKQKQSEQGLSRSRELGEDRADFEVDSKGQQQKHGNEKGNEKGNDSLEFEQLSEEEKRQIFETAVRAEKREELSKLNEPQQQELIREETNRLENQFKTEQGKAYLENVLNNPPQSEFEKELREYGAVEKEFVNSSPENNEELREKLKEQFNKVEESAEKQLQEFREHLDKPPFQQQQDSAKDEVAQGDELKDNQQLENNNAELDVDEQTVSLEQLSEDERRQVFESYIQSQREQELKQLSDRQQQEYVNRQVQELERQYQEQQRQSQEQQRQYQVYLEQQRQEQEQLTRQRRERQEQQRALDQLVREQQLRNQQFQQLQQNQGTQPTQPETGSYRRETGRQQSSNQPSPAAQPKAAYRQPTAAVDRQPVFRNSEVPDQERPQQSQEKANNQQASQQGVGEAQKADSNQISLAEVKEWYANGKASDEFQIEAGIEKPQEGLTPAQVMYEQREQAKQREQQAENLVQQSIDKAQQKSEKTVSKDDADTLKNQYLEEINSNAQAQINQRLDNYRNQKREDNGESFGVEVNQKDLEAWRKEAQALGRSKGDLAEIDFNIAAAEQNGKDGKSETYWQAAGRMASDRQEFKHKENLGSIDANFQKQQEQQSLSPQQQKHREIAQQIASNWEATLKQAGTEVGREFKDTTERYAYAHLERQAQKNDTEQQRAAENSPSQVLVKSGELDEWRAKAEKIGRSEDHLTAIDDIRNERQWLANHPNDQVAIEREEYNALRRDKIEYDARTPSAHQMDSSQFYATESQSKPLEKFSERDITIHNANVAANGLRNDLEKAGVSVDEKEFKKMDSYNRLMIHDYQQHPLQRETPILTQSKDLQQWSRDAKKLHQNYDRSDGEHQETKNSLAQADKKMDRRTGVSTLSRKEVQGMNQDRKDSKALDQKQEKTSFQFITAGRSKGKGR